MTWASGRFMEFTLLSELSVQNDQNEFINEK